jgi:hypothetical protein
MRVLRRIVVISAVLLFPSTASAQGPTLSPPRPGIVTALDGAAARKLFAPEVRKIDVIGATKAMSPTSARPVTRSGRPNRATCIAGITLVGAVVGFGVAARMSFDRESSNSGYLVLGTAAGGSLGVVLGQRRCKGP